MKKAIFIDKDGTLIPDIPFNGNADLITLENGIVEGLTLLRKLHYLLIIISNQSGIALGYIKEEQMVQVQRKILQLLKPHHISINGFYYCPHHPQVIHYPLGFITIIYQYGFATGSFTGFHIIEYITNHP